MIPNRPESELKQIALDLHKGLIFSDRHLGPDGDLASAFMALRFLDKQQLDELKASNPGLIFEYLEKQGTFSCNGVPSFFSHQYLSQEDSAYVFKVIKQLRAAEQNVLESVQDGGTAQS
jgi:hypothetical protein